MVEERFLPALIEDEQTDYTLRESATSCWITVGKISVYIRRDQRDLREGVIVELHERGNEAVDPLSWVATYISDKE